MPDKINYEAAVAELESIVRKMENDQLDIDSLTDQADSWRASRVMSNTLPFIFKCEKFLIFHFLYNKLAFCSSLLCRQDNIVACYYV